MFVNERKERAFEFVLRTWSALWLWASALAGPPLLVATFLDCRSDHIAWFALSTTLSILGWSYVLGVRPKVRGNQSRQHIQFGLLPAAIACAATYFAVRRALPPGALVSVATFCIAWAALSMWMWRRARRLNLQGHCSTCGYNLVGNVSGICPECGERVDRKR